MYIVQNLCFICQERPLQGKQMEYIDDREKERKDRTALGWELGGPVKNWNINKAKGCDV